jgi:methionyl-tRNA synthetase
MKKKRLITSALPYVNNIPHLGNLIQVLSADVFARFCRLKGYETLYVCGTDEYGTATETKALEEGVSPKELCDRYYTVHSDIYSWFNINFDYFGRTSTEWQTTIVQDIFNKVDAAGYISEKTIEQLYCASCDRFLADRFVRGTCPHCGYSDARGDQCEDCGKLLDPTELVEPRCGVCGKKPELKSTRHLYLDLPKVLPRLEAWIDKASVEGFWARNAVQMTRSWIRDGLKERCITRDLKWGIPVPKKGFENKVFYVWFDAPIGYISITANLTEEWEAWWKNNDEVDLFQFIGKDNIPFHTVIFPSSLIASGDDWTLLHHMSSTEYLNYESGKFSKSKGVGVFGTDAKDTGIPADVWRFYIFYNRPEKSDALFTWSDFQEKVNGELIGNLGNLVNRSLTFVNRFYNGALPEGEVDGKMVEEIRNREAEITAHFERAELRDAFRKIFALSSYGNKSFQEAEPWKMVKSDPESAATLLKTLVYLVRDLAVMVEPFIPETSSKILGFLELQPVDWSSLADFQGLETIKKPEILFEKLENDQISALRERFSGSQKERAEREKESENMEEKEEKKEQQEISLSRRFEEQVDLRVAKIVDVQRHPEADKLYIEKILLGEEERTIVSGLVPYYTEEELLGHNIILVYNLKPAKLRGVKSEGMLLAADDENAPEGERKVEVLFADWAEPGDRVHLTGSPVPEGEGPSRLTVDAFFTIPVSVKEGLVQIDGSVLKVAGESLKTATVRNGTVG